MIFYGLNNQIERDDMTELMRERRPLEASQLKIKNYTEQAWHEMAAIMADLDGRGIASAYNISPGFAIFPEGLKKVCMMMSDVTDRGMPVAISGYDLPADWVLRTSFWIQGRAMACLSWAVKSIKVLQAYQLTVQDDMYYDHGVLMNQRIDVRPTLIGVPNLLWILKEAVLKVFTTHGIKGMGIVENRKTNYVGIS